MKKVVIFILFAFLTFCFAQETEMTSGSKADADMINSSGIAKQKEEKKEYAGLPSGYRGISLGMGFEEVKQMLKEDTVFGYRGERDISLLPSQNRILIETSGSLHIKRAWFQFYEDKLYVFIIQMNTDKIDYYSVYSALMLKYGEPSLLNPKRSVWQNENMSMTLERPLAIKYIDLNVFNMLVEKGKTEKAFGDVLREEFINDF